MYLENSFYAIIGGSGWGGGPSPPEFSEFIKINDEKSMKPSIFKKIFIKKETFCLLEANLNRN